MTGVEARISATADEICSRVSKSTETGPPLIPDDSSDVTPMETPAAEALDLPLLLCRQRLLVPQQPARAVRPRTKSAANGDRACTRRKIVRGLSSVKPKKLRSSFSATQRNRSSSSLPDRIPP